MRVLDIATKDVVTISPKASIREAAKLMRERHVGTVVIVDVLPTKTVPIGLITDRDIVVGPVAQDVDDLGSIRVEDIASKELQTVRGDRRVEEAARMMLSAGIRRMPVVDSDSNLTGIITYDDLTSYLADELADFARVYSRQQRREQRVRK